MKCNRYVVVGLLFLVTIVFVFEIFTKMSTPEAAADHVDSTNVVDHTRFMESRNRQDGNTASSDSLRSADELIALNDTLHHLHQELRGLSHKQALLHAAHMDARRKVLGPLAGITPSGDVNQQQQQQQQRQQRPEGSKVIELMGAPTRTFDRRIEPKVGGGGHGINPSTTGIKMGAMASSSSSSSSQQTTKTMKKAVLFTMDSISAYEADSKKGGAAGEILIRKSLESAFTAAGVALRVIRSDSEFETIRGSDYDIIIVDPWTWAAKGWVPKPPLRGQDSKVYILDFFGSERLRGGRGALQVPPERFLTAFGSPWNTFLGYQVENGAELARKAALVPKLMQGVVWGKDPRHFEGRLAMLQAVLTKVPELTLVSTATRSVFKHPHMQWRGHQTPETWRQLLVESKFLIGLGDPLLGPSAIDAIAAGCMYINPTYSKPKKSCMSQHPYAVDEIGEPYVCSYRLGDHVSLQRCVQKAMDTDLKPWVVPAFTPAEYQKRVNAIFNLGHLVN